MNESYNPQQKRRFKWYEYNNTPSVPDDSHLHIDNDGIVRGITIPHMRNKSSKPRDPFKFSKPVRKT